MGAWGHEPFENDMAMDWVSDLQSSEADEVIDETFDMLLEAEPDDSGEEPMADADLACAILAAGEVVAARIGKPAEELPEEVIEWVGVHSGRRVAPALVNKARKAVARVKEQSELQELWAETGDDYARWQQSVDDLLVRLG